MSQCKALMHLLLGCLLTSLFEAHPSLLGDKCHLPTPRTQSCLVADRCLVFMNILCTARPRRCRRSFDLHFKRKFCLCHCQRLCVTHSAFAVVTCLFECSNRTATHNSSGMTGRGIRASLQILIEEMTFFMTMMLWPVVSLGWTL